MEKGIDFLESRIYRNISESSLNKKLVDLPPIFKTFVENFKWNNRIIKYDKPLYFLPYLKGGEVYLDKWDYEEIFSKPIVYSTDNLEELAFITIGTTREGIHVGTKGKDIDKIFTFENSLENSHIQIADNIFQFVNGLTNSISGSSETETDYRNYMSDVGYYGDDLEEEVNDWKKWKSEQKLRHTT